MPDPVAQAAPLRRSPSLREERIKGLCPFISPDLWIRRYIVAAEFFCRYIPTDESPRQVRCALTWQDIVLNKSPSPFPPCWIQSEKNRNFSRAFIKIKIILLNPCPKPIQLPSPTAMWKLSWFLLTIDSVGDKRLPPATIAPLGKGGEDWGWRLLKRFYMIRLILKNKF